MRLKTSGLIADERSSFTVQHGGFPLTHKQMSPTLWMNVIPCFSSEGDSCEFGSQKYFILCGFGGILSCGTTHTAVVPLDLVKCRMQVRLCVLARVTRVHPCELTPVRPLISMLSVVLWCMSMCVCSCVPSHHRVRRQLRVRLNEILRPLRVRGHLELWYYTHGRRAPRLGQVPSSGLYSLPSPSSPLWDDIRGEGLLTFWSDLINQLTKFPIRRDHLCG